MVLCRGLVGGRLGVGESKLPVKTALVEDPDIRGREGVRNGEEEEKKGPVDNE